MYFNSKIKKYFRVFFFVSALTANPVYSAVVSSTTASVVETEAESPSSLEEKVEKESAKKKKILKWSAAAAVVIVVAYLTYRHFHPKPTLSTPSLKRVERIPNQPNTAAPPQSTDPTTTSALKEPESPQSQTLDDRNLVADSLKDLAPTYTQERLELPSTTEIFAEADSFLGQISSGQKLENVLVSDSAVERYTSALEELRKDPENPILKARFFIQYRWYPKIAFMAPPPSGLYGPLLEAFTKEREIALREYLQVTPDGAEELNSLVIQYGPAQWAILNEVATGFKDLVYLALKKGCDPNIRDEGVFGNTALTWSIANDAKETTIELVRASKKLSIPIDLNMASTFNGNTPLILAITKGHKRPGQISNFELTKFLLEEGADPNIADDRGNTPLHYAYFRRDVETAELLIKHGAKLEIQNKNKQTPTALLKLFYAECQNILYKVTNGWEQGSCTFPDFATFTKNTEILQSSAKTL